MPVNEAVVRMVAARANMEHCESLLRDARAEASRALAALLAESMARHGWTYRDVGARFGLSAAHVHDIRHGRRYSPALVQALLDPRPTTPTAGDGARNSDA